MIRELTKNQKRHVREKVKEVISGATETWDAPNEHYPLMALNAAILEIAGVEEVDRDTNGWAWDYWQYYSFEGKQFTLSGSGYHGGHTFYEREQP